MCDVLVSAEAEVLCVDNLSTGLEENIQHLVNAHNFRFQESDITKLTESSKQDLFLHFASRASPEDYQLHQVETLKANSSGTENMLELTRRNDADLVYASSSEVYGDSEIIPTSESYWGKVNPIGPRSCYDEGKRYGEALCMAYKRMYDLDVRILRIFNTYGPRIRADSAYARAVPRFIVQALRGDNITIFGDGKQTRAFCYVTDTVTAILKVATIPAASGEVFNLGNPHEMTILEVAKKIKEIAGSTSQIVYGPLPVDDPKRRCPDIAKISRILSWKPTVDIADGLGSTISWFRAKLANANDS